MTFSYRHIFLLTGFALINLSFLFYGLDQTGYEITLYTGLVISLVSFCFILFKKDNSRNKFLWTIILGILAFAQQTFEPFIIKQSFKNFITDNQNSLTVANKLISQKKTEITIYQDSYSWFIYDFDDKESKILRDTLNPEKISLIHKDQEKIYYLPFEGKKGVYYFFTSQNIDKKYKHIFGQWYY